MSRCFPYPPPGYVRNGIRDEALIESIKLQREGEKTKKERKKERRREKKDLEKARQNGEVENKHRRKKRHIDEKGQDDKKQGDCLKSRITEAEHLEKSSLTEEHGDPASSQNSSDSTLNSSKRQKQSSPSDGKLNSGSIFRIRLPLQRHKDPEVLPDKEQPCSSVKTDGTSVQLVHEPAYAQSRELVEQPCPSAKSTVQQITFRTRREEPCLSRQVSEMKDHPKSDMSSNLCGICSPSLALKVRDLVETWVPSQIHCANTGDQEWLFGSKQKHNPSCADSRSDVGSVGMSHGSPTPWPCSQYLPNADIYALPFTVPF